MEALAERKEALDIFDYIRIRDWILENRKPLLIQRKDGNKIAIVLTKEAKVYYKKRGYQAFVLRELFENLLSYETFEEQKQMIGNIFRVINTFEGQIR